jgi:hypothetical protein
MHQLLTTDLGPDFYGFQGTVDGNLVCMATPEVEHNPAIRKLVRDLFRRHGDDCATCMNCPIGRLG